MTLMQHETERDDGPSIADRLHDIANEMLRPFGRETNRGLGSLLGSTPPFDISKPNEHDSKAEYLLERRSIERGLQCADGLFNSLWAAESEEKSRAMLEKLRPKLDQRLKRSMSKISLDHPVDLVRKSAADVGGTFALLVLCLDIKTVFKERLDELDEQRDRFWNVSHRAPDYYAREIALRLARFFARETGERPTAGTSPVDGSPSTAFSRALAQTLEVLEITSNPKLPAAWAIGQITEEDTKPERNPYENLLGAFAPTAGRKTGVVNALLAQQKSPPE